jgi:hypothetical protein
MHLTYIFFARAPNLWKPNAGTSDFTQDFLCIDLFTYMEDQMKNSKLFFGKKKQDQNTSHQQSPIYGLSHLKR